MVSQIGAWGACLEFQGVSSTVEGNVSIKFVDKQFGGVGCWENRHVMILAEV